MQLDDSNKISLGYIFSNTLAVIYKISLNIIVSIEIDTRIDTIRSILMNNNVYNELTNV